MTTKTHDAQIDMVHNGNEVLMTKIQDMIEGLIREEVSPSRHVGLDGIEEAAQAIIAVLPDMIVPLVWEQTAENHWDSGNFSINRKREMFRVSVWRGHGYGSVNLGSHSSIELAIGAADADNVTTLMKSFGIRT